jgi:alpha-tubulin suppressor-like RCC1 family protein
LDVDCVVALGAIGLTSCALQESSQVRCWGRSAIPGIGGGFAAYDVPGAVDMVQVAYSAALSNDGQVLFWGWFHWAKPEWQAPQRFAPVGTVAGLASHGDPRCFITPERTVRCWGMNLNGEVGDGTKEPRVEPVAVQGLSNVVQLVASGLNAHALLADGRVMGWGEGSTSGLGHIQDALVPEEVIASSGVLTDVTKISSSGLAGCALREDKTVWCWGDMGQGEQTAATKIWGLGPAIDVAAGFASCALLEDRSVWCWGDNWYGQLGNGGFEESSTTPVRVALPTE